MQPGAGPRRRGRRGERGVDALSTLIFPAPVPSRLAFVTGATGFLGLNLVDALLDADWEVVALHRKTSNVAPLRARGVDLAEGSLDDRASLDAAIPEDCDA